MNLPTPLDKPTLWVAAAFAAGLAVVAFSAGALGTSHIPAPQDRLLGVQVMEAEAQRAYPVERRFVGRVEARRESDVGFELPGLVAAVHVDDGAVVAEGQVLATLDTALLLARRAELVAAMDQAQADLDLARTTRGRVREANALDAVSGQRLDEAEEGYNAASAALGNARSAIHSIDVQIRKSRLTAPYDALVSARFVDEGQVIQAGVAVLSLLENTRPEVRIAIASDAINGLVPGSSHILTVGGRHIPAVLRTVLPQRSRATRGVDAVFELGAPFNGIRRGDLAVLTLTESVIKTTFALPLAALTESARGIWAVYVAEPAEGGTRVLHRRQVEVLHQHQEQVFVRGALQPGDAVVTTGLHRLVPGQRVVLAQGKPAAAVAGAAL